MAAIDGRPKYMTVADDLRVKIANGTPPVGSELPSTSRLMESYGVSITVVRAAVRELRSEGLVMGQPGKGVYVLAQGEESQPSPEYVQVTQQIETLRADLERSMGQLGDRMTRLEKSVGRSEPSEQGD